MVSRKFVALLPTIAGSFGLLACGSSTSSFAGHTANNANPVLVSAAPQEAAAGESVTLTGTGFSFVAPENVVSVGSASVVASSFDIADDGTETLSFEVPGSAGQGEAPLFVIVGGRPSNRLTLNVAP